MQLAFPVQVRGVLPPPAVGQSVVAEHPDFSTGAGIVPLMATGDLMAASRVAEV
jgi:hypothetical protein